MRRCYEATFETMTAPSDLAARFLGAYNRRDADTMRSMLSRDITYIRPGPTPIEGVDAIIDRYRKDWEQYDNQNTVRRIFEDGDEVAMEVTAVVERDGQRVEFELAVMMRWVDDKLVYYRLYTDPIPEAVAVSRL